MSPAPPRTLGGRPLAGSWVALPTPFRDGALDVDALEGLIDFHAERRTAGLVVAGTTGEAPTLRAAERDELLTRTLRHAAGRLPVVFGVGTNSTESTIARARRAADLGADGLLVVTPYYNTPSQAGLLLHYGLVAEATDLPIVLYNVPSRTAVDLQPATAAELARRHANVVAIKDSTRGFTRARELVETTGLVVLCGDDGSVADYASVGAAGVVGVVTNLVPDEVAELVRAAAPGGDEVRAAELVELLAPLLRVLYVECNPVPVKAAMARLGLCTAEVRPPLAPLSESNRRRVEAVIEEHLAPAACRAGPSSPR